MDNATAARRRRALDWLAGRVNYERAKRIPYDEESLKLDRMRELARRLGAPQERLGIVHVAGTKGKGTTSAMIAAALKAGGLRTGVFSSPHLDRIEERFAVDGRPCSAETLVRLVDLVRPVAEGMDDEPGGGPTYFDLTTAMALALFAGDADEPPCDAAVLEVGLGGRLDSTNVVTPLVSVITSISLDHTQLLGDTVEEIAAEKAGIVKPGVLVVSGVTAPGPAGVIERIARERSAPLWALARDFDVVPEGDVWRFTRRTSSGETEVVDDVRPALPGRAHAENAAVALATLGLLADREVPLSIDAQRRGVSAARLPARMERFEGRPLIVVDGAHNDASAAALAEALDTLTAPAPRGARVLVVAISADKDARAILARLTPHFAAVVATRYLENPRSFAPEALAALVEVPPVTTAPDPASALDAARHLAGEGGAVVVAGSLFLAGEVRRLVVANGERGA